MNEFDLGDADAIDDPMNALDISESVFANFIGQPSNAGEHGETASGTAAIISGENVEPMDQPNVRINET